MIYRVTYSPTFLEDVRDQVAYLRVEGVSQEIIDRWFGRLFVAVDSLADLPRRHPVDELQSELVGSEIRRLVFAERYLVLYRVDEVQQVVRIDALTHGARDRRELEEKD